MTIDVLLNIVAQVMFFVVNLFVFPGIAEAIILRRSDAKDFKDDGDAIDKEVEKLKDRLERLKSRSNTTQRDWDRFKKKGEKLIKRVERHQKIGQIYSTILNVFAVIESWTIMPVAKIIRFVVLLLTFHFPRLDISVENGVLDIGILVTKGKRYWLNPIKQLGNYINNLIHVLFGTACGIALLAVILPNTFNSIIPILNEWSSMGSGTINVQYFVDLLAIFREAAWETLVIGGFKENPVLMFLFIIAFGSIFANTTFDFIGEDGKITGESSFIPLTIIFIALFNVIFCLVNSVVYTSVAQSISFVGMALLFVMIIKEFSLFVVYCVKEVADWLWDKVKARI